jgi:hypothetical protein
VDSKGRQLALTPHQIKRIQELPRDHTLVSGAGWAPIVRRPDGRLLRVRSSGRLVLTSPVQSVQGYLHVNG